MQKLSNTQLSEIKDFIHSRGFTTIEVEMEILDHVASAVEAKLEANPNKSLTKAIQEVHAGFGPLGFSVMEDQFRREYTSAYLRIRKSILKSYFWADKAHISIAVFTTSLILAYFLFPLPVEAITAIIYGVHLIAGLALYLYFRSMFKKWRKRSLVIASQFVQIGGLGGAFFYILYFFGKYIFQSSTYSPIIFSAFLTITVIFTLITKNGIDAAFNWTNERYLKYATH